jgi:hypothetical protein
MTKEEVKKIAAQKGIVSGRLRKDELIRRIQISEGNAPCYATGKASVCGQTQCLWRADCR